MWPGTVSSLGPCVCFYYPWTVARGLTSGADFLLHTYSIVTSSNFEGLPFSFFPVFSCLTPVTGRRHRFPPP